MNGNRTTWRGRLLNNLFPRVKASLIVLFVDPDIAGVKRLAAGLRDLTALAIAPTAKDAYAALNERIPSLIVMDLDLPDTSGLDLLTTIRSMPALRQTPVLVITTRESAADKVAAFRKGADDYMVKPVTPSQFALHVHLLTRAGQVASGP